MTLFSDIVRSGVSISKTSNFQREGRQTIYLALPTVRILDIRSVSYISSQKKNITISFPNCTLRRLNSYSI